MATSDLRKVIFKEALVFAKSVEQTVRNEANKGIESEKAEIEQRTIELLEKERNLLTKIEAFDADSLAFLEEVARVDAISKSLKEKETNLNTEKAKLRKEKEEMFKKMRNMSMATNTILQEQATEFDRKNAEFQEMQAQKEIELNRKRADVQEMLDRLRAKEEQLNAKDRELALKEENLAKNKAHETKLKQREEARENKLRELEVEKAKVMKVMNKLEETLDGWMSIDEFLEGLTTRFENHLPSETVLAITGLLRHLQKSNKIVNGVIKVDNDSTTCVTLGTLAKDKTIESISPLVTVSSQAGLNTALRELYNSLLGVVRGHYA